MKSLNKRLRSRIGKTDYYHRKKLLKNYDKITRIRFGKKLNYYFVGVYDTISPQLPDRCFYYAESRMMRDKEEGKRVQTNLTTSYYFGSLVGLNISKLNLKDTIVLDLSRRKKITYKPFLFGLLSSLPEDIREKVHHGYSEKEIEQYVDSVPKKNYQFISESKN